LEGRLSWEPHGYKPDGGFRDSLNSFLGEVMYPKFLDYWLEVVEKYGPGVDSSRRKGSVLPDFLARRGEDFFVVEVKTNNAHVGKDQRDVLRMSTNYGFIPVVYRVRLELKKRTFGSEASDIGQAFLHD
jgi:hypothetical protein